MGITGLIPFLEKSSSKVHLKDLRGCTVAVDTYCWLHKGVFSCADKLCRGEDTDMYVTYCLKYVSMLLSYDIKPILVFDGRHLPAKALTEKRRRESRDVSKKRAAELLRLGKTAEAMSQMRRCIDVTHEMALRLIKECRLRNVDCVVAPYEADAQMAFLNKLDIAQYVITEDSDLTLFGCKKIIFKLDLTGAGLLVEADKLYLSMGCRPEKYKFDKFRTMCILSGCDYLDSLPGIGLAKACKFVLMTEEDDMKRALPKIPQYLNKRNLEVDGEYVENFLKADATFKHMYVFNPLERRMERLNDLSVWNTDERYCSNAGELLESTTAFQLALGNINPFSLKVLDTWNPDQSQTFSNVKRTKHKSIWQSDFKPHTLTDKKPVVSLALQFKKIDYSKILPDEEKEDQRPDEEEVVSMYNVSEPPRKKHCAQTDNCIPTAPITPVKKAYNPFPIVSPKQKKPIYEPSLKPSPRKQPPINPFKKSISTQKIEVRSRFFASDVSLGTQNQTQSENEEDSGKTSKKSLPEQNLKKIIEEVTRIEELSKENNEKTVALYDYNSPSPIRTMCPTIKPSEESPLSSIKTLKPDYEINQSQIPSSIDSGISSIASTASNSSVARISCHDVEIEKESNDAAIDVSDEEGKKTPIENKLNDDVGLNVIELSDSEEQKKAAEKIPLKQIKSSVKPRGMGLSKVKKMKSVESKVSPSQTRLSMFGFQKRPSLK